VRYFHIKEIEDGFDYAVSQTPGELNYQMALALYNMALGWFVSNGGQLNNPTPQAPQTPQPTTHSQSVPTPPNPRPSAPLNTPRNPNPQNKSKRIYTENERELMRIYNMTEEEYDKEMNLPATEVVTGGQSNG
jgi:hypothetical protein